MKKNYIIEDGVVYVPYIPAWQRKAAVIDAWLYGLGTFCGAFAATMIADSSYTYVWPWLVFWLRAALPAISTTCLAVIGFRSKSYGKGQQPGTEELTDEINAAVAKTQPTQPTGT